VPHQLHSGLPKDFLKPCLLLLLRERPAHGYELAARVGDFGFDHSDPGALYRTLRRLETDELVRSAWAPSGSGPRRRVYGLTRAGIEELDRRASDLADGERRIDTFLSRYLRARGLPAESPRHRAVSARMAAHEAAARERGSLGPRR
jgi:PadR family transcriptional regulator, regulatory protein PadR